MMLPSSWALADDQADRDAPDAGRTPSSPSNSWSSAETQGGPGADSPLQEGSEGRRPKRCKISREQLAVLIKSFEEEPLPNFDQRQTLAKVLGMTPRSVQIWFQNRRQRLKPLQPKAASTATPLCGLQSAAMAARAAQASYDRTAQQHLGMPGLAAAAGLCGGGHGNIDQLMMSHALGQHQSMMANSGSAGQHASAAPYSNGMGGHSLSSYGDVMEPFAATKALLSAGGAMGLSPELLGRSNNAGGQAPPGFALDSMRHSSSNSSLTNLAATSKAGGRGSPYGAAQAPAAAEEKASGLLLLLACADGNSSNVE